MSVFKTSIHHLIQCIFFLYVHATKWRNNLFVFLRGLQQTWDKCKSTQTASTHSVDKARRLILKSASKLAYISHISTGHIKARRVPQRANVIQWLFLILFHSFFYVKTSPKRLLRHLRIPSRLFNLFILFMFNIKRKDTDQKSYEFCYRTFLLSYK